MKRTFFSMNKLNEHKAMIEMSLKMRKMISAVLLILSMGLMVSCSSDDDTPEPVDASSFVTSSETDFFINYDRSVNLIINGEYVESQLKQVIKRGWVYGTTSNQEVNATNTIEVVAPSPASITIENLTAGKTYYIRGFLKFDDGTYFYGNEIQASTDVDASSSRSVSLVMIETPQWLSSTEITPKLFISDIMKEVPKEVGFEYSLDSEFSNSTRKASHWYNGGLGETMELIKGLTPATTYFIRPYAKYEDGTITNGGSSVLSITTKETVNLLDL